MLQPLGAHLQPIDCIVNSGAVMSQGLVEGSEKSVIYQKEGRRAALCRDSPFKSAREHHTPLVVSVAPSRRAVRLFLVVGKDVVGSPSLQRCGFLWIIVDPGELLGEPLLDGAGKIGGGGPVLVGFVCHDQDRTAFETGILQQLG